MTSFEVVTVTGAPIKTFDERRRAVEHARNVQLTFPGCRVEEVERVVKRRVVWSERHQLIHGAAR